MGLSSSSFGWLRDGIGNEVAAREIESQLITDVPGSIWHVDAQNGGTSGDGHSWSRAFATMEQAFTVLGDNDVVRVRGPLYENLTAPDGVTGVTIVGDGSGLRWGSTTNVSEGYAPSWRTASGVTGTPLLQIHAQGWTIRDMLLAAPSADCAIELLSDGSATPEKTVSGTRIIGCEFAAGLRAIEDNGGSGYVTVQGCHFTGQTGCSIINTSTSNALPLEWKILGNYFGGASAAHIDAAFSKAFIHGNVFGLVAATGLYIDLTGGANNMVTGNYLAGTYTTADYVAGTNDLWLGNWVTVVSTQAPNGFTILPAAA
jgi:hypothetical protein